MRTLPLVLTALLLIPVAALGQEKQKTDAKAPEKKAEPKKDDKKPEPKKDEKKPEPKKTEEKKPVEKKPEPKKPAEPLLPDANLEAAVRTQVFEKRNNTQPLTEEDLKKVFILHADEKKIKDLKGLDKCTNLREIRLARNEIVDV